MHTQEDSKLCAHTGGFRALCTRRRIPSSVHTGGFQALCTGKGSALCTQGLKLCAQARVQLCAQKAPSSVHKRVQALCTKGSKLCAQAGAPSSVHKRAQLCAQKAPSSVHKRLQALCTKGSKLCAQKAPSSVHRQGFSSMHRQGFSSVHTRAQALCTGRGSKLCAQKGSALCTQELKLCAHTGGFQALCTYRRFIGKNRVFELSNCTSLISSDFYIFQTYSR